MTRCIHCTRCVRFSEDIAGVPELGATGRGESMQITTYLEKAMSSEMSGNVIDLCPVGALTSKPYAFVARPWEIKKTESIDVMDAVGSNIRIDSRGNAVLRVLPRLNEAINEEWISDKTRYACDGLRTQRLDQPYVRVDGALKPASWEQAFAAIREKVTDVPGERMAALAGDMACTESMLALKELMISLGCDNLDCRQDGARLEATDRSQYLFNTTIEGLEEADVVLLVGTNPRWEAPLVNARIRKRYLRGGLKVYHIGEAHDLTYPVEELGNDPAILEQIARGKHEVFDVLSKAKKPVIILGSGALAREDGESILKAAHYLATHAGVVKKGWNGFNVLHMAAARVGGLDIGFVPQGDHGRGIVRVVGGLQQGEIDVLYLLGVDEIDTSFFGKDAFVIYQGHHGDIGAERADVILPGAAYTEKNATYVNMEGRPQRALQAVAPPGEAREDWRIVRALSEVLGKPLPYDTLEALRARMVAVAPQLGEPDVVQPAQWTAAEKVLRGVSIDSAPFESPISNFYMTDSISRVSKTMAECTRAILAPQKKDEQEAA